MYSGRSIVCIERPDCGQDVPAWVLRCRPYICSRRENMCVRFELNKLHNHTRPAQWLTNGIEIMCFLVSCGLLVCAYHVWSPNVLPYGVLPLACDDSEVMMAQTDQTQEQRRRNRCISFLWKFRLHKSGRVCLYQCSHTAELKSTLIRKTSTLLSPGA